MRLTLILKGQTILHVLFVKRMDACNRYAYGAADAALPRLGTATGLPRGVKQLCLPPLTLAIAVPVSVASAAAAAAAVPEPAAAASATGVVGASVPSGPVMGPSFFGVVIPPTISGGGAALSPAASGDALSAPLPISSVGAATVRVCFRGGSPPGA